MGLLFWHRKNKAPTIHRILVNRPSSNRVSLEYTVRKRRRQRPARTLLLLLFVSFLSCAISVPYHREGKWLWMMNWDGCELRAMTKTSSFREELSLLECKVVYSFEINRWFREICRLILQTWRRSQRVTPEHMLIFNALYGVMTQ